MLEIRQEPPRQPDALALLAGSDAESAARYPVESRHGVSVDALEDPACRFFIARQDGVAIACGGVMLDAEGVAEVKRLFVAPPARCRGIARQMLTVLEECARREGAVKLRLETGIASHAALALYRRVGFVERERFGGYPDDPLSVFMEKPIPL